MFLLENITRPVFSYVGDRIPDIYSEVNDVHNLANKFKFKNVKFSLCLTKHKAMKSRWGSGCIALRILDFGTTRK